MALVNNNNNNNNIKYFDIQKNGYEIKNVRVIKDNFITFTLDLGGISLYNMRVCEAKNKDVFVAPPQQKGNNGKYYNLYGVYLTEEAKMEIIDKVCAIANGVNHEK